MSLGTPEAPLGVPDAVGTTAEGALTLLVEIGRRVLVVANLGLGPTATATTTWASSELARALDGWEGPGLVLVAGNFFDLTPAGTEPDAEPGDAPHQAIAAALAAHPRLTDALRSFGADEDRRIICIPGSSDGAVGHDESASNALGTMGIEVAPEVDLHLARTTGTRVVRVCAGVPDLHAADSGASAPAAGPVDATRTPAPERSSRLLSVTPDRDAPWQAGLDRLADQASMQRFLTSRLLYRRFARLAWWLLVPLGAALILRLPFVATGLDHLFFGHPGPSRAINAAHRAGWGARLLVAAVVSAVELAVLAAVLTLLGRKAWRTLGGGQLEGLFGDPLAVASGATANDIARDTARVLASRGYAGMVTGATLQAELTHLGEGFFACTGAAGEVVEEHPGRLGVLPVFLEHRQVAWVELETGAELHARLLLARIDIPPATVLERIGARYSRAHDQHPVVVGAYPQGASWPPGPDLGALHNRARRVRR